MSLSTPNKRQGDVSPEFSLIRENIEAFDNMKLYMLEIARSMASIHENFKIFKDQLDGIEARITLLEKR